MYFLQLESVYLNHNGSGFSPRISAFRLLKFFVFFRPGRDAVRPLVQVGVAKPYPSRGINIVGMFAKTPEKH